MGKIRAAVRYELSGAPDLAAYDCRTCTDSGLCADKGCSGLRRVHGYDAAPRAVDRDEPAYPQGWVTFAAEVAVSSDSRWFAKMLSDDAGDADAIGSCVKLALYDDDVRTWLELYALAERGIVPSLHESTPVYREAMRAIDGVQGSAMRARRLDREDRRNG